MPYPKAATEAGLDTAVIQKAQEEKARYCKEKQNARFKDLKKRMKGLHPSA